MYANVYISVCICTLLYLSLCMVSFILYVLFFCVYAFVCVWGGEKEGRGGDDSYNYAQRELVIVLRWG